MCGFVFYKEKRGYERRISDGSSDVCSSELDIEQVDEARFGPVGEEIACAQRADQRRAEQEGDADRGEMAVRGAFGFVEAVGVDQRMRDRQRGGAIVVNDDDHVDARLLLRT